jgi:hypothetical protein
MEKNQFKIGEETYITQVKFGFAEQKIVSVFKGTDLKLPLVGTTFSKDTTPEHIMEWAERCIKENFPEKNNEVKRTQGEWLTSGKRTRSDKKVIWSMQTHGRVLICTLDNTMYQSEANAEFICEAVNNYDKLKEDNEILLEALKTISSVLNGWNKEGKYINLIEHAIKAIKKAENK